MADSKHTSEWSAHIRHGSLPEYSTILVVRNADNALMCELAYGSIRSDEAKQDALARAGNIAAAPDLLEALKALADECDRIGAALGAKGIGATVLGMRVTSARKAIAKAEGRS